MSGFINNPIARAPRQSGLKKPRPLRSVSLQEGTGQSGKKEVPERQISSEYPSHSSSRLTNDDHGEVFSRVDSSSSLHSHESSPAPTFQRQNSTTSQDSSTPSTSSSRGHSRKSSIESNVHHPNALSVNVSMKTTNPHLDANANRLKIEENKCLNNSAQDLPPNSLHSDRYKKSSNIKNKKGSGDNITLATLLTTQGKELVLSGTCVQTILSACRVLLNEIGASIIRLETIENPAVAKTDEAVTAEPPSPSDEPMSPVEKPRVQYSKEKLIALSELEQSRKAPMMWNILAPTHADCCIPAGQVLEFFEAIDFNYHDGTLVVEERRMRRDMRE